MDFFECATLIFMIGLVLFFGFGFAFQIDLGQPQPTSELITTNVSILLYLVDIGFYPGATVEVIDTNGRGYIYSHWFQLIVMQRRK